MEDHSVAIILEGIASLNDHTTTDFTNAELSRLLKGERWWIEGVRERLDRLSLRGDHAFFIRLNNVGNGDPVNIALEESEEPAVAGADAFDLNIVTIEFESLITAIRVSITLRLETRVHEVFNGGDRDLSQVIRQARIEEGGKARPPAEVESINLSRAGRGHRVIDELAWKLDRHRRRSDGDLWWIEDERRMISTEVDRIVSRTTHDSSGEGLIGAEDVDIISATGTIDLKALDASEVHKATRACHDTFSHYEGVRNRSSHHNKRINTRAAVDGDRSIFEVGVAVASHPSEEVGKVCDLFVIIRILTENEEGLEEETIITATTVEVNLSAVEIHLKGVVLTTTVDVELIGSSIGEILGIGDRDTLREFESAVPDIRDKRHGANDDLVISVTCINQSD